MQTYKITSNIEIQEQKNLNIMAEVQHKRQSWLGQGKINRNDVQN